MCINFRFEFFWRLVDFSTAHEVVCPFAGCPLEFNDFLVKSRIEFLELQARNNQTV